MSDKFLLFAAVGLISGLALSQTTLGTMFKLGTSTTANLPASSTTIEGALLYDLDAGMLKANNGTTWKLPAHVTGLNCAAGDVLTTNGVSEIQCINTITNSSYAVYATYATSLWSNPTDCGANQYANAIDNNGNLTCATVTGGQVSGAVATATALASDPTDCTAGQYATTIAASGNLTCAQVATSQLSGTITDAQLANNYSGTGSCTGNNVVTAVNDNAAPTCNVAPYATQAGSLADQSPTPSTCPAHSYVTGIDKYGNVTCGSVLPDTCCAY